MQVLAEQFHIHAQSTGPALLLLGETGRDTRPPEMQSSWMETTELNGCFSPLLSSPLLADAKVQSHKSRATARGSCDLY
jgi:hypothetical protein